MFIRRHHRRETKYVRLDPRFCEACWKCVDACPLDVLGKIDMGEWHRHVRIRDAEACNGCKKCVRVCDTGALTYIYVPHTSQTPAATTRSES